MERRHKLLLLIILALLLLGFGIWYLLQPILDNRKQPPALPNTVTPSTNLPPRTTPTNGGPAGSAGLSPELKTLENLAGIIVARIGSGASGEGFRGYQDVLINATPTFQKTLLDEQRALQQTYPANGATYGRVTRVVAIESRQAVSGAAIIPFTVQVQRVEDAGNPSAPTSISYKEATVSFERQSDKTYLVNGIVWKDIEL